jgi:hypothetical protein
MKGARVKQVTRLAICTSLTSVLVVVMACRSVVSPEANATQAFASPEAAGEALVAALQSDDPRAVVDVLGGAAEELLKSGDAVDDQRQIEKFVTSYHLAHSWTSPRTGTATLEIGEDRWPFPIPVVENDGTWRFDLEQGADEILNRRIGRNELDTIQSCLAFVDAEREYYQRNPRGRPLPEYAGFILSSPGEKDGLYWETAAGEAQSPLGPIYAAASSQGYALAQGKGQPFHGYRYRVLHAQGARAAGGAYDYRVGDDMTRGFALIAWPAKYDASGVMTFLVNQLGVVYQKDLGPETAALTTTLASFDPDESWSVVPAAALALPGH